MTIRVLTFPRTIKRDLFGILDMVAFGTVDGARVTIGIQFTDASDFAKRMSKVQASEWTEPLLSTGWVLLVWGFYDDGRLRVSSGGAERWVTACTS